MSRKIKYRVWDEEKKKYCTEYNAMTLKHDGEFCIERGWRTISGGFEVEQYTGGEDRNGKEIYEGDIVEEDIDFNSKMTDGTFRYKVYWNEDELCWSLDPIGPESIHNDLWELNSSCRVISNVHENPELMGGEE